MKITGKKELGAGKWLALEQLEYTDFENKTRFWETVSRKRCAGAVVIEIYLADGKGRAVFNRKAARIRRREG